MNAELAQLALRSWLQAERDGLTFRQWRGIALGKSGDTSGEPFAEPDPRLPRIEIEGTMAVLRIWRSLRDRTLAVLGLASADKGAKDATPVFTFASARALLELAEMEQVFIQAAGAERGPLVQAAFRMWVRGLENAAEEFDADAAIAATRERMRRAVAPRAMDLVRSATIRTYRNDIVAELERGAYNGLNPRDVARTLRQRFGAHDYDWERLTRSELAMAQAEGKHAQYAEMGVERYDYVTAQDSRVSAICRSNAAGGPYLIGQGPLPMRDSHPNCRCSVRAHVD